MSKKDEYSPSSEYQEVITRIFEAIEDDVLDLDLSGIDMSVLPAEIGNAKQIRYLDLSDNKLKVLPDAIGDLENLEELILRNNQISALPQSLKKLRKLKGLYASGNNFKTFPSAISSIPSLVEVELSNNKITDIPKDLMMPNVNFLALEGNKIYHFPKEVIKQNSIYGLQLFGNPIYNIPLEIFNDQGDCADEVRNYFESLEIEQVTHLYEVKLLIVGRGQVGKTCLSRKLMNPNYEVTFKENTTEGIHINKWNLACLYNHVHKDVTVNMWDFGGQEIYHATHQFFLTKRSL